MMVKRVKNYSFRIHRSNFSVFVTFLHFGNLILLNLVILGVIFMDSFICVFHFLPISM